MGGVLLTDYAWQYEDGYFVGFIFTNTTTGEFSTITISQNGAGFGGYLLFQFADNDILTTDGDSWTVSQIVGDINQSSWEPSDSNHDYLKGGQDSLIIGATSGNHASGKLELTQTLAVGDEVNYSFRYRQVTNNVSEIRFKIGGSTVAEIEPTGQWQTISGAFTVLHNFSYNDLAIISASSGNINSYQEFEIDDFTLELNTVIIEEPELILPNINLEWLTSPNLLTPIPELFLQPVGTYYIKIEDPDGEYSEMIQNIGTQNIDQMSHNIDFASLNIPQNVNLKLTLGCFSPSIYQNQFIFQPNTTFNAYPNAEHSIFFSWGEIETEPPDLGSTAGDVNDDGVVNVTDIVMIVGHILGQNELTPTQIQAADVNGDGNVTVTDIINVISEILNG